MCRYWSKALIAGLFGCVILAVTGCNAEKSLTEAASAGEVESQYDLAIYYSELDEPQKTKSFEWMKKAAGGRFAPAMKDLAGYYLNGYGTPVDYHLAAEWYGRYLATSRDSADALRVARQIMLGAATQREVVAGFTLFKTAIMFESQNGNAGSEIATEAAKELMMHATKFFGWTLDARKYTDAIKLLEFSEKCRKEYPNAFADDAEAKIKDMRKKLIAHMENN